MAVFSFHLVRYGLAYVKQTEAADAEQVRERREKQLQRRAQELGFTLQEIEMLLVPLVD